MNPPIPTKSCSKNQNFKIKQEEQQQTRKKKILAPLQSFQLLSNRIKSSQTPPHASIRKQLQTKTKSWVGVEASKSPSKWKHKLELQTKIQEKDTCFLQDPSSKGTAFGVVDHEMLLIATTFYFSRVQKVCH